MRLWWIALLPACGRIGFDPGSQGDAPLDGSRGGARSKLTLDRFTPVDPATDFMLPVVLDDTRAARDRMAVDGSDVRFYAANDDVLPHQIETAGTAGGQPLVAWVRVPTADFGITLTVEYGIAPRKTSCYRNSMRRFRACPISTGPSCCCCSTAWLTGKSRRSPD